jgi:hypothetical protein
MKKGEKGREKGGREMGNIFRGKTDREFPALKVPKQIRLVPVRVILTERKLLQAHLNFI